MSDIVNLVTAITALVGALTGLVGVAVTLVKIFRREPKKSAHAAMQKLAAAAEDGEITPEELREIAGEIEEPS